MAQGRPRNPRKERQWRQWLKQWQHSGLSVRAFCAQHHLPEHRFYAWRRLLRDRTVPFLPVRVLAEPERESQPSAGPPLEVVLANGRRLHVAAGFDADALRRLLAVLEEARSC